MAHQEQQEASGTANKRVLTVQNKMGIHARPAAMIVRITNKFATTEVWVDKDGETVNAKSIMGLMMLAAGQGTTLAFSTEGPDGESLLDELEGIFNNKFEEV